MVTKTLILIAAIAAGLAAYAMAMAASISDDQLEEIYLDYLRHTKNAERKEEIKEDARSNERNL